MSEIKLNQTCYATLQFDEPWTYENYRKTGGYAAPSIAKRLEKAGGRLAVPPEGFAVVGTEGPMKQGELERAAEWAGRCGGVQ